MSDVDATAAASSSSYHLPPCPTYYPPLPSDHPPIPPHSHSSGKCPFSAKHEYCPPQEGDIRSPCPALNTMANHGYINRSGKNLTANALVRGLTSCYNLTYPLAVVLSYGGFLLLHKYNLFQTITLHDVAKHGYVEHDASLVHKDVDEEKDKEEVVTKGLFGKEEVKERIYAPIDINMAWVEELVRDARIDQEDSEAGLYPFGGDPATAASASSDDNQEQGRTVGEAPSSLPPKTRTHAAPPPPLTLQPPTPGISGLPTTSTTADIQTSLSGTAQEITIPHHVRDSSASTGSTTPSTAGADSLFSMTSRLTTSTAVTTPSSSPTSSGFRKNTRANAAGSGSESDASQRSSPVPEALEEEAEYTGRLVQSPTPESRQNSMTIPPSQSQTLPSSSQTTGSRFASNYTLPKPSNRVLLSPRALARSRVRRQYESYVGSGGKRKLDALHQEIARGEMAIVLGMWGVEVPLTGDEAKAEEKFPGEGDVLGSGSVEKRSTFKRLSSIFSSSPSSTQQQPPTHKGIPIEWLREWIAYERLPGGWRKLKKQGLFETVKMSAEVKKGMEALWAKGMGVVPDDSEPTPASGSAQKLGEEPKPLEKFAAKVHGVEERVKAQVVGTEMREKVVDEPQVSYCASGWRAGTEF